MKFIIETEREEDGRWIAEVMELPGCLVYGRTQAEAVHDVKVLALQILASRVTAGEEIPDVVDHLFAT